MPLDSRNSQLSRMIVILDKIDKDIITLIAKKRKQSHSEIIGKIIHNWIENNPDLLKNNYDIDLSILKREKDIFDNPPYFQESIQKLENYSDFKNSAECSRITFSLDSFDQKVLTLMRKKRKQYYSVLVRKIVHNWIENNKDILNSIYNIKINDIAKPNNYKQLILNSIQKLIKYSELFKEIEFDRLAEHLETSRKILREIIIEHKEIFEKNGVKLRIRGNYIVKD